MNVALSSNNWLSHTSSRELHDLGINRSDIHSVARQLVAL